MCYFLIITLFADPPVPVSQSSGTVTFEESSQPVGYKTTLDAAMTHELRFSMAVSCFPTPAVFDWPSGFSVVNQQQLDDVTVFDLSVPVTDVLVYSLIGKNGNIGQLNTEYIINVKPAGALLF